MIVYDAFRSGERDIYWQPVGGGIEQSLDLPGQQRNPSVSGGLIAFESIPNGEHPLPADLFVYQIATNRRTRHCLGRRVSSERWSIADGEQ